MRLHVVFQVMEANDKPTNTLRLDKLSSKSLEMHRFPGFSKPIAVEPCLQPAHDRVNLGLCQQAPFTVTLEPEECPRLELLTLGLSDLRKQLIHSLSLSLLCLQLLYVAAPLSEHGLNQSTSVEHPCQLFLLLFDS